jgi:hypothetical protein
VSLTIRHISRRRRGDRVGAGQAVCLQAFVRKLTRKSTWR